ncbi:MAG: hypothetical protein CFE43_05505 [Burkholderiales bacterium PBB3]|nr:MAG: hypothetical protein CFE43_05505 [Burkholderiales bacterium PBB3]
MRLYHMTSLDVAMKHILPERRMRLGQFDRLNDPFELLCASVGDKRARHVFKFLREYWTEKLGVLCMGRHWKSPLMWAHYAGNHTGVCLGFDVPEELAKPIRYEGERLQNLINASAPLNGVSIELLEKVLTTKYAQWSYEEEWRLFSKLEEKDPIDGFYYLPFSDKLVLREIIVGSRCTKPVGTFRKLVEPVQHTVKVIKARPSFETFTMVRQMRVVPIVVKSKN